MTHNQLLRDLTTALGTTPTSVTLPSPQTPVQQTLYGRATEIMIQYLEACETRTQRQLEHLDEAAQRLMDAANHFHEITTTLHTIANDLSLMLVNRELEREVLELLKAQVT